MLIALTIIHPATKEPVDVVLNLDRVTMIAPANIQSALAGLSKPGAALEMANGNCLLSPLTVREIMRAIDAQGLAHPPL